MHPNVNVQDDDLQVDAMHLSKSYSTHEARVVSML